MSEDELEINSNKIEKNSDEREGAKRLCVHELTRKLKKKQRKEYIVKTLISLTIIFIIFFLSVIFY